MISGLMGVLMMKGVASAESGLLLLTIVKFLNIQEN